MKVRERGCLNKRKSEKRRKRNGKKKEMERAREREREKERESERVRGGNRDREMLRHLLIYLALLSSIDYNVLCTLLCLTCSMMPCLPDLTMFAPGCTSGPFCTHFLILSILYLE